MRFRGKAGLIVRAALMALPLSLALGACETLQNMNPFEERKTPIAGDRRQLFPQGVPGVEYNAPPQQPTNSNVQLPVPEANPQNNPDANPQNAPNNPNTGEDPWATQRQQRR